MGVPACGGSRQAQPLQDRRERAQCGTPRRCRGLAAGHSAGSAALRPVRLRAGEDAFTTRGVEGWYEHRVLCVVPALGRVAQKGADGAWKQFPPPRREGRGGVILGAGRFLGIRRGVCSPAMSVNALKQRWFVTNTGKQSLFDT